MLRRAFSISLALSLLALASYTHAQEGAPKLKVADIEKPGKTDLPGKAEKSEKNEKHGAAQIARMLADFPEMRQLKSAQGDSIKIDASSPVWKWVVQHFSATINGGGINWGGKNLDPDKPLEYAAEHEWPSGGKNGAIFIREKFRDEYGTLRPLTVEERWAACVFELLNIEGAKSFEDAYNQALEGRLTKKQYVRLNTELEFKAVRGLADFYQKVWKPWANSLEIPSDESVWSNDSPEKYEDWMRLYETAEGGNPYTFWEDYYDTAIIPYLKEMEEYNKAMEKWKKRMRQLKGEEKESAESKPEPKPEPEAEAEKKPAPAS